MAIILSSAWGKMRWCRLPSVRATVALLLLSGCSTVDHFGPRSARFNNATFNGRSQAILSNIIRAAYGKPLQFTDLTTLTGQSTLSGELGATIPFAVDPSGTARTYSGTPKIGASGTSTFNMANLNSREFYNGLQTPVSVENIANFISSGFDRQLLLFLAISDIEIRDPARRLVFHSDPSDSNNYRLFFQAISLLREAGLSTRPGQPTPMGAPLSAAMLSDPKVIATMFSASSGDLSLKEDPPKSGMFRFFKKAMREFCFDPILIDKTLTLEPRATTLFNTPALRSIVRTALSKAIPGTLIIDSGKAYPPATFEIDSALFCDATPEAARDPKTEIRITTRSVEGIFQFLGEVTRKQLGLTSTPVDLLSVTNAVGQSLTPFRVVEGAPSNAAVTILAEGTRYSIVTDASGLHDQSTRTFQVLSDLLAIQSSAKDLPTPNVISILSP